jgi:hypothetical protein
MRGHVLGGGALEIVLIRGGARDWEKCGSLEEAKQFVTDYREITGDSEEILILSVQDEQITVL